MSKSQKSRKRGSNLTLKSFRFDPETIDLLNRVMIACKRPGLTMTSIVIAGIRAECRRMIEGVTPKQ